MQKNSNDKQKEVIKVLETQKIRDVRELESYKLSICHPFSAGMVGEPVEPLIWAVQSYT
jgi:hypothetical protein